MAQFIGKKVDGREAGRMLRVANVVEGTVEQADGRVKVAARLERVSDGAVLWSETYDQPAADLYAVQSAMAAGISGSLNMKSRAAKHVPNPEAHDLVMKGRFEMQGMSTDALDRAGADFRRAIDLDPQYALAYYDLGVQIYNYASARGSTYRKEEERKRCEELLRKALALDPDMAAAHGLMASMAMQYDWDWDGAERELRLGAEGAPTPNIESVYAFLLLFRGRFEEADKHIARLQEIDPFEAAMQTNVAEVRMLEGRIGEVRAITQKLVAAYPRAQTPKMLPGRMRYLGRAHGSGVAGNSGVEEDVPARADVRSHGPRASRTPRRGAAPDPSVRGEISEPRGRHAVVRAGVRTPGR